MYYILTVENDNTIASVLKRTLEKWNYRVVAVTDFGRVLKQSEQIASGLVLPGILLPFSDDYYWCDQIRRPNQVLIIFMSSASNDMNLVMTVSLGADDFLARPSKLEVVLAKIQVLLCRAYTFNGQKTVLRASAAALNIGDGSPASGGGKLDLTKNKLRIMRCLTEQKGRVVSRDSTIRYLWESEHFIDDNTLTVNMTHLRKELGSIGLKRLIETEKGLGYLLSEAGICNEAAMG